MLSFTREITAGAPGSACVKVCGAGPGGAELVLLRQVLGVCLRLSMRISADCPSRAGS
ncbi:hypothetical protein ACF061_29685 [Streptomyces sp. NPDC015220]|uniref:hypothetical protein n=1 Tax=Streptomyces sp. NPDC015220 TaxID=3364947 RepID=UPI0036FABBBD